jgi:hypothetical protein
VRKTQHLESRILRASTRARHKYPKCYICLETWTSCLTLPPGYTKKPGT